MGMIINDLRGRSRAATGNALMAHSIKLSGALLAVALGLAGAAAFTPASALVIGLNYQATSSQPCNASSCVLNFEAVPDKRLLTVSNVSCQINTTAGAQIVSARLGAGGLRRCDGLER